MECSLLFVYGTLRQGCENPHARGLHAVSTLLGPGTICGELFLLGDSHFAYPGATHVPSGASRVHGDLLQLHDQSVLTQLDAYEGIGPEIPLPHEYERILVDVTTNGGGIVQAWCYICKNAPPGRPVIPSGNFADL